MPSQPAYDLRTPDQRVQELQEQVRYTTSQLARHKQVIARLLERQTKYERMLTRLAEMQGVVALGELLEDDLDVEPGVRVWAPEDMDV